MIETVLHLLIVLIYFIVILPLTIFLVTKNENKVSQYLNKNWPIVHISISGIFVFLLSKYISFAFSLLFLQVIGFFIAWYYLFRMRNI